MSYREFKSALYETLLRVPSQGNYIYVDREVNQILPGEVISSMDFQGQRIGVIAGCFCPLHSGHYDYIYDACVKDSIDYMFINTSNKVDVHRARHGVPSPSSLAMLVLSAENINRRLGTRFFISNSGQSLPWDINSSMRALYMIETAETDGAPSRDDIERARLHEAEDPLANASRAYLKNLKPNDGKVQYSVIFRDRRTSPSASKFVRSIMAYRDGSEDELQRSISYLPDFIDRDTRIEIVQDMIAEYGAYLK